MRGFKDRVRYVQSFQNSERWRNAGKAIHHEVKLSETVNYAHEAGEEEWNKQRRSGVEEAVSSKERKF